MGITTSPPGPSLAGSLPLPTHKHLHAQAPPKNRPLQTHLPAIPEYPTENSYPHFSTASPSHSQSSIQTLTKPSLDRNSLILVPIRGTPEGQKAEAAAGADEKTSQCGAGQIRRRSTSRVKSFLGTGLNSFFEKLS